MRARTSKVSQKGQSIAELPTAISVFILLLVMPLVDLSTIALRATYIHSAARNAAHYGSRAKTFLQNGDKGELSVVNKAKQMALATKQSGFAGVNFDASNVKVSIIGSPLKAKLPALRQDTPVKEPSQEDYLYQIEVTVAGKVEPLVRLSKDLFGSVPGLTEDMPVVATYSAFCEEAKGLSK